MILDLSFILRLVLAGLTVYRLAQLVTIDEGPLGMFRLLRNKVERLAVADNAPGIWSNFAEFISCPYCIGVWIAGFCTVLVIYPTLPGNIFLILFGLAGFQAYLQASSET